ncbi:hypothetical protein R6Q59_012936 [Mikania micrantha]
MGLKVSLLDPHGNLENWDADSGDGAWLLAHHNLLSLSWEHQARICPGPVLSLAVQVKEIQSQIEKEMEVRQNLEKIGFNARNYKS